MDFVRKAHWFLASQVGIDFKRLLQSLHGLPFFLRDWTAFRRDFTGKMALMPCLHDRYEEGGATKSEYFWQDLLVARAIHAAGPTKHVDIGSRVDGFVAHVASFREVEVFDVRPIGTSVPGVVFRQADLMDPATITDGYCDSISCLHAIEHFGLGRYGDPINPQGYWLGLTNIARLLRPGGTFYLSTPIGKERVEFNANWVFDPRSILHFAEAFGMVLQKLTVITPTHAPIDVAMNGATLDRLAQQQYQLGLFIFLKT